VLHLRAGPRQPEFRRQPGAKRHVHWHLAQLPPGVPLERQQLAALDVNDGLDLSEEELAERIRVEIDRR
jgi:hypothetical protein